MVSPLKSARAAVILVVDDNEGNRALAKATLEDEGYGVVLAAEGVEAIAAFERERPECVLLDVRMPGLDGFSVCRAIRKLPGGDIATILFLTALRNVETFDQALEAGADDFLTKPILPSELLVRIETALMLQYLRKELAGHYELVKRQRSDLLRLQLEKERLMAFVVHDLKNPVNAMDLHAQLLLRHRGLPEELRDSAQQIRTEARQLSRLILNLLDLSKADEGKLVAKPARVDLRELARDVVAELEATARQRGVTIAVDLAVDAARADEDLLRRTLANLVENALRHSPSGKAVTLAAATRDEGIELRVVDRGAGVPIAMRERVFEPFVQMEGKGRPLTSGGRGLGLTFCKLAIEAHGGRIWVDDASPGAIFALLLPHER